jgi:hypothetical protein
MIINMSNKNKSILIIYYIDFNNIYILYFLESKYRLLNSQKINIKEIYLK